LQIIFMCFILLT